MNISTPVIDDIKSEFLIDDRAVVNKALTVASLLDEYINDLKVIARIHFNSSKDDNEHQSKLHGLAWTATYVEALKQMSIWAEQLLKSGSFSK